MMARIPLVCLCTALLWSADYTATRPDTHPTSGWLKEIRLSPDGLFILAQDEAEITLLSTSSLAVIDRIPAEQAAPAAEVLFVGPIPTVGADWIAPPKSAARAVRYRVGSRTCVVSPGIPLQACGTVALSPDKQIVARDQFDSLETHRPRRIELAGLGRAARRRSDLRIWACSSGEKAGTMDFEARMDGLTGVVESLAASVVAHDNQIEAQNENIGALGRHFDSMGTLPGALAKSVAEHDRQIAELTVNVEGTRQSVANLEKRWTAYLRSIHPRQ